MQISSWVLYGIAEVVGVLLLLSLFLLIQTRNLKKLVKRLQKRLLDLVQETKNLRATCSELESAVVDGNTYEKMLDDQLEQNLRYHASLNPDQDITLDLNNDTPLERQIASVRHAFLSGEKEAYLHSKKKPTPHWPVIHEKLFQLMTFFRSPSDAPPSQADDTSELLEALAEKDARIENLEKFKTLFFELEDKWLTAQGQASDYQQQISELTAAHPESESLDELMQHYQNSFNEFGAELSNINPKSGGSITQIVDNTTPAPQEHTEELEHLKSVAANQHQLISELQQRLTVAYSAADKDSIIDEMKQQLSQQVRFMEESETCINLLEEELDQTHRKMASLTQELNQSEKQTMRANQQMPKMEKTLIALQEKLEALLDERSAMNHSLKQAQQENEQLVSQLQATMKTATNDTGATKEQLKQLQKQYTELESKYLTLRMQS